jgi:hypothetical protein
MLDNVGCIHRIEDMVRERQTIAEVEWEHVGAIRR